MTATTSSRETLTTTTLDDGHIVALEMGRTGYVFAYQPPFAVRLLPITAEQFDTVEDAYNAARTALIAKINDAATGHESDTYWQALTGVYAVYAMVEAEGY